MRGHNEARGAGVRAWAVFAASVLSVAAVAGCATVPRQPHAGREVIQEHGTGPGSARTAFFVWPVQGRVSSYFGEEADGIRNKGLDIASEDRSFVRAAQDGIVVFSSPSLRGFGRTIIIEHDDGFETVYAYNSELLAKTGDVVKQNDCIARVGTSGRARQPMLHFEIRKDGRPRDPLEFLSS